MEPKAPRNDHVVQRLSLVRIAKDIFLSDWYVSTAESVFSGDAREVLLTIAKESREERDEALRLVMAWAQRPEGAEEQETTDHLAAIMARDFLDDLIRTKQASAEVFQKAAFVAPPDQRERWLQLAALDIKHAMQLRELILSEFPNPYAHLVDPAGRQELPSVRKGPDRPKE